MRRVLRTVAQRRADTRVPVATRENGIDNISRSAKESGKNSMHLTTGGPLLRGDPFTAPVRLFLEMHPKSSRRAPPQYRNALERRHWRYR